MKQSEEQSNSTSLGLTNNYREVISRFLIKLRSNPPADPVDAIKRQGIIEYFESMLTKFGNLEQIEHLFDTDRQ